MLINIISINLTINFICDFNSNPVLERRYYEWLCSMRSLNVYWIIFKYKNKNIIEYQHLILTESWPRFKLFNVFIYRLEIYY